MFFRLMAATLVAASLSACGTPAKIDHKTDPTVQSANSGRSIDLRRLVSKQGSGEHVGQLRGGLACVGQGDLTTRGINIEITDREVLNVVYDELKAASYNMVGAPDDLFDNPAKARADYQLAGVLSNVKANLCFPLAGFGNLRSVKGEYAATVEWQLFSRQRDAVIYSLTTTGSAILESAEENGIRTLQMNTLRQAAKGLLADEGFRNAVSTGSGPGLRPGS